MIFIRNLFASIWRQISIILAIGSYENNRKSTKSSFGAWESLLNPLQIMLFFIFIRVGFSFLFSGFRGGVLSGGQTGLYFNIVVFIAAGFAIFFPFRQLAAKALSGLKLRSPFTTGESNPDILLGLSVNDIRTGNCHFRSSWTGMGIYMDFSDG